MTGSTAVIPVGARGGRATRGMALRARLAAARRALTAVLMPAASPPRTWGEAIQVVDRVSIQDNGEPLVDPCDFHPGIVVAAAHPCNPFPCMPWVRRTVAHMLAAAQEALPAGVRLQVVEGYRRLSVQKRLFRLACEELRQLHPEWTPEQVREAANSWVAAPDVAAPPPHATGGAVDVALADVTGAALDMTGHGGWNALTAPMDSDRISPEARRNRDLLRRALTGVGLTNYPGEWWHWSYGEPGWAVRTGQPRAHYGAVEARMAWEI